MTRSRRTREAKYSLIAADLAAKIRTGEYQPGQALPSQRELSVGYGVTLMTLRQALQVLGAEGLIVQQAGRGTFVAPPRVAYRLDSLRSLADDLREQGHAVTTEVLGIALHRPSAWVAEQLGLVDGEGTLRLERLRFLDGRPAVHQVSWVREPYGSAVRDVDFGSNQLYAVLAGNGVAVNRATERIRPEALTAPIATLLKQPAGIPVFVSERVTFGLDTTPVVVDKATILSSVMEIRTERAATKLSVHWRRTTS